jgi:hypothetical protein
MELVEEETLEEVVELEMGTLAVDELILEELVRGRRIPHPEVKRAKMRINIFLHFLGMIPPTLSYDKNKH